MRIMTSLMFLPVVLAALCALLVTGVAIRLLLISLLTMESAVPRYVLSLIIALEVAPVLIYTKVQIPKQTILPHYRPMHTYPLLIIGTTVGPRVCARTANVYGRVLAFAQMPLSRSNTSTADT